MNALLHAVSNTLPWGLSVIRGEYTLGRIGSHQLFLPCIMRDLDETPDSGSNRYGWDLVLQVASCS